MAFLRVYSGEESGVFIFIYLGAETQRWTFTFYWVIHFPVMSRYENANLGIVNIVFTHFLWRSPTCSCRHTHTHTHTVISQITDTDIQLPLLPWMGKVNRMSEQHSTSKHKQS